MKPLKTIVILMSMILLAACSFGQAQTPAPTQDVSQTLDAARTSAVQTFEAEQASLATATPLPPTPTLVDTATPAPTETPVPALPTNTPAPVLPTNTSAPVSGGGGTGATATPVGYSCGVTIVAPAYLSEFDPYEDIDAQWTVKNTGGKTWGVSDVDLVFISGTDMAKFDKSYDIAEDVAPGESMDVVVDLLAPALAGTYRTTWGLTYASSTFCTFSINIVVK